MTRRSAHLLVVAAAVASLAGGYLQAGALVERGYRFVEGTSPYPGHVLAEFTSQRWSDACIPVRFTLNTTVDPIPGLSGDPAMTLQEARAAITRAMASWNEIRTSYIEMHLDGHTDSAAGSGFDFVNEITFAGNTVVEPTIAGLSRSVTLLEDTEAFDGLDGDGDGDLDFSSSTTTCRDIDGDGDIELPAGWYPAGTIVENDVLFFPQNYQYGDVPPDPFAWASFWASLEGVAAHEFGHSHGLHHSSVVDTDRHDGTGATMAPGVAATDGFYSSRTLHTDDVAWSSYHYPEGSAQWGPAALQKGDVAFAATYSLITGEIRDPEGWPVVGAQPFAVTLDGAIVSSTISGRVRLSVNPDTLQAWFLPPDIGIADGRYVLPVPRGVYRVGLESADGFPLFSGLQNQTERVGGLYGQLGFAEEYWNGPREGAYEADSGQAIPVAAVHDRDGIDFVVNASQPVVAVNGDVTDRLDSLFLTGSPGLILAVRIPTERLLTLDAGQGLSIQAGLFGVTPFLEEEAPTLPTVMITTGTKQADGTVTIDLAQPLARESRFQVQSLELSPLHVKQSRKLGDLVTGSLAASGKDLFVVAVFGDEEHPLVPGVSPVGVSGRLASAQTPRHGETYASFDGGASFINTFVDVFFGLEVTTR